ncbi:MAG: RNA polymerase sigma factor [Parcubacteria group bacterium GW2011_GWA2_47_7]|nr:MAG: RNA polymerase sigma factor [Parcubacteria group bacterium GW2011_GWA2_47_7]
MESPDILKDYIAKASTGDREAFRGIFEAANDKVFRFLLGQFHDRDQALDTLQDVFIDIWKGLPRFRYKSDEEFWGFVFLVARRKVYACRKNAHKQPVPLERETLEFLHEETLPTSSPHEDYRILESALTKMGTISREVIALRYWSELSFKEIALAMNTTENSAKVRHHRALKELQTYLPAVYVEQQFT